MGWGKQADSEQVRACWNQSSPSLIGHVDSEICLVKGSYYAHGSQLLHQLHQNTDSQSDIYSRYTVFQESWMQAWIREPTTVSFSGLSRDYLEEKQARETE